MGDRLRNISRHTDAVLAVAIIGLILLLIVPLPPFLIDTLICFSIVFSLMTLLLTLYIEKALEFSAFPALLLFLTLYRLGINIASTRMILTRGDAGDIIRTFGDFVIQGNTLVGLILFVLLTTINFIVITKGAGRIAEVTARFTLEAMPGKQLAIDGELTSGLINQEEAKLAREKVSEESDFHGAMDGAAKFVKGDAIASIVITAVNIFGGLLIGMTVKELSWSECWTTFIRLTVGDGIVSQLPALFVSVGAGIMVTRVSKGSVGSAITRQIFHQPKVFLITAITLFILCAIPGMPILVILPIASGLLIYSILKFREKKTLIASPLEVQLGSKNASLIKSLHQQLESIRHQIGNHLGIRIPSASIAAHSEIPPNGWAIKVKGIEVASGQETHLEKLANQLKEEIESHAYAWINRQDIARIIQEVKNYDAAVIEELVPKKLSAGQILKVFQNLLKEGLPIRDSVTLFERLADHVEESGSIDLEQLTEEVRKGISHGISEIFFGKSRIAHVITLDPKVEQMIAVGRGRLSPKAMDKITKGLIKLTEQASKGRLKPVVVASSSSRLYLKQMIEKHLPRLPVLSYNEVSPRIELKAIGTLTDEVLI
ncbi:MAG: flagellar biosynthesis protein FlhA [Chlamydiales bacterium]